jgi:hypothetical protein
LPSRAGIPARIGCLADGAEEHYRRRIIGHSLRALRRLSGAPTVDAGQRRVRTSSRHHKRPRSERIAGGFLGDDLVGVHDAGDAADGAMSSDSWSALDLLVR